MVPAHVFDLIPGHLHVIVMTFYFFLLLDSTLLTLYHMGRTRSVPSLCQGLHVQSCHITSVAVKSWNWFVSVLSYWVNILDLWLSSSLGMSYRGLQTQWPSSKTGIQYLNKADKQLRSICSHNGFITAFYEPIIRFYINNVVNTKTLCKLLE